MESFQNSGPSAKLSTDGELPCVLVYSSQTHVEYIKVILDCVRVYLKNNGFRIVSLKDDARNLSIYSNEFLRIAKECVLGVVILDGLRPNVLFEFGVLIGLGKPIILLKDKKAEINIKTLYENVCERNCRDVTGLTFHWFGRLKNPLLRSGSSAQFSDLSMMVSVYDHNAAENEAEHISNQLNSNFSKIWTEIEKEGEKLLLEKMPPSMSDSHAKKYKEYAKRLNSLSFKPIIEESDLTALQNDFTNLQTESNKKISSKIYSLIASLYSRVIRK